MTSIYMTGKRRSCGLVFPAYLAKNQLSNGDNQASYVVLSEEEDSIFYKKINTLIHYEFLINNLT